MAWTSQIYILLLSQSQLIGKPKKKRKNNFNSLLNLELKLKVKTHTHFFIINLNNFQCFLMQVLQCHFSYEKTTQYFIALQIIYTSSKLGGRQVERIFCLILNFNCSHYEVHNKETYFNKLVFAFNRKLEEITNYVNY